MIYTIKITMMVSGIMMVSTQARVEQHTLPFHSETGLPVSRGPEIESWAHYF